MNTKKWRPIMIFLNVLTLATFIFTFMVCYKNLDLIMNITNIFTKFSLNGQLFDETLSSQTMRFEDIYMISWNLMYLALGFVVFALIANIL